MPHAGLALLDSVDIRHARSSQLLVRVHALKKYRLTVNSDL